MWAAKSRSTTPWFACLWGCVSCCVDFVLVFYRFSWCSSGFPWKPTQPENINHSKVQRFTLSILELFQQSFSRQWHISDFNDLTMIREISGKWTIYDRDAPFGPRRVYGWQTDGKHMFNQHNLDYQVSTKEVALQHSVRYGMCQKYGSDLSDCLPRSSYSTIMNNIIVYVQQSVQNMLDIWRVQPTICMLVWLSYWLLNIIECDIFSEIGLWSCNSCSSNDTRTQTLTHALMLVSVKRFLNFKLLFISMTLNLVVKYMYMY